MVTLKVKSRLGSTRPSESRPTVGGGKNFKVFSENDRIQVGDGSTMTSVREVGAASRKSAIAANKGVISNATSNSKGDFKSMEKSSKTYGASGNMNARKALTDVTNAQGSSTTAAKRNISKIKVSAGSKTKTVGIPLRKSFTVREIRSPSHGGVQLDAPSGGLRVSLGDRKNSSSNGGQPVATKDRFARKPMLPTTTSTSRKSLPVPRRVNRVEMNNTKENAGSSETANGQRGLPSKLTTGRRVSSQLTNARSNLWKTRVSDGFVQMVTSNAYQVSSRKSVKPVVKTTVKASTSQRTLKSKSISGQNKSKPTSTIASKDEEKVTSSLSDNSSVVFSNDANQRHQPSDGECSLKIDLSELIPENNLVVISDDTNQRHQPSDGESSLKTDLSELIPRKSSSRRKSYTTSLMEKSKILKENGEVREQDNLPSIDDECNHLEVSEYIDAIYQYYWVTEAHSQALSNYMSIQTEITPHMRGVLVNWLIEVHFKYDLMPETLYLTVTLLDQYLSQVHIKTSDMQLVGLTSLLLASKYEDFWHPRVKDLISISAESYTRDQMLGMEKLILRKLKFRLNAPTPYVFLIRFLKAAQSDMKLEHMAFFLIDLCLVEYEALAFKPSLLCASALYVARCTLQITPSWTPLLQKHARYEVSQIRDCADMILKFHKAAGKGKLTVAYEKYSRKELGGVAAVKPLDRLPR
ncbi:putative cyclin-B3-1 isoform X3 [Medicago truncatula]|uniref:putative cyclin-B3-1 isoform X3 n=1 Tax=Medicago truncatula TaxID=3880 RepID=UPI0019673488|nr:putative cyclin-B3-1 isoform X3 [Medicago truncatula]